MPKFLVPESVTDVRSYISAENLTIDFGCGMGDATISLLKSGNHVVAIDVHTPGICRLADWADRTGNNHLGLVHGDGLPFLHQCVAADSVDTFLVLFPDPWPKARHNKRRVIQPEFLDLVATKLKPNGRMIIATDIASYAQHIREVLQSNHSLVALPETVELPDTKFGTRAKNEGREISTFVLGLTSS
ncbi:MAG: hypothetical protein KGQ38_07430 [Actinomycetales bacterium]|nr:hypothetical protein [Actinomycetales bacterium]